MRDDVTFEQLVESATVSTEYPGTDSDRDRVLDSISYHPSGADTPDRVNIHVAKAPPSVRTENGAEFEVTALQRNGVGFRRYSYTVTEKGEISDSIGGSPDYQQAPSIIRDAIEDSKGEIVATISKHSQQRNGPLRVPSGLDRFARVLNRTALGAGILALGWLLINAYWLRSGALVVGAILVLYSSRRLRVRWS